MRVAEPEPAEKMLVQLRLTKRGGQFCSRLSDQSKTEIQHSDDGAKITTIAAKDYFRHL
jgi:hypothetical protein